MYWEGECPEWIRLCQETVRKHGTDVRLLTPGDFDALRSVDRDIDLNGLHVAHRADFVRSFLLAHFGGLWIDSDCIVMQPLHRILKELRENDFIAHRERSGSFSNGFMGACRQSTVAGALYARNCQTLRLRQPRRWMSLGGDPLTEILATTTVRWQELPFQWIQPVCWSRPDVFFAANSGTVHAAAVDEHAICYMMSNTEVKRYQTAHRESDLLAPDTFFTYLIRRALTGE